MLTEHSMDLKPNAVYRDVYVLASVSLAICNEKPGAEECGNPDQEAFHIISQNLY